MRYTTVDFDYGSYSFTVRDIRGNFWRTQTEAQAMEIAMQVERDCARRDSHMGLMGGTYTIAEPERTVQVVNANGSVEIITENEAQRRRDEYARQEQEKQKKVKCAEDEKKRKRHLLLMVRKNKLSC